MSNTVTVLDCIQRVPSIVEGILTNRKKNIQPFIDFLGERADEINELIFVGSGTSSTCAMTSKGFVERVTKLRTSVIVPEEFYYDRTAFNKNALYIFTSQSGNSILTWECLKKMKADGYMTVAITEKDSTPMAKDADAHIDMGCGYEEYGFRTIGYCASILTHMMLALELGLHNKTITQAEYDAYITDAEKIPASHKSICEKTLTWFEKNKEQILDATSYIIYGAGSLWGVALEGALKTLEMARRIAIGYELEEGLHGPVLAFNNKTCIISLNAGGYASEKSLALGKMTKNEFGNGFVFGEEVVDEKDLQFPVVTGEFKALEFAPTVEIFAYCLTLAIGIDLTVPIKMPEEGYYEIHDEKAQ